MAPRDPSRTGDPACRDVLQLVVDAYACQHPGEPGRRSAQSVAIHRARRLAGVGTAPRHGPRVVTPGPAVSSWEQVILDTVLAAGARLEP